MNDLSRHERGTVTMTRAERETLLELIRERLAEGSYYGNREQYTARLKRLTAKLESK